MRKIVEIITFLGVQTLLGKRVSFPYGLLIGLDLLEITALVVASDMAQTFILLNCFDYITTKLQFLKKRESPTSRLKNKIETWGIPGLIAISALPYGGGALTGSILAVSANIRKTSAYWSIVTGCIIGSLLFCLGFGGIMSIFNENPSPLVR
jgi:uncharacterized membrane protein